MAKKIDPLKLSPPHIFLIRMLVFIILVGIVGGVLSKQIIVAFMANPGLNGLIIAVEVIGIALSLRQVLRLYPEIAWSTISESARAPSIVHRSCWRRWRRSSAPAAAPTAVP